MAMSKRPALLSPEDCLLLFDAVEAVDALRLLDDAPVMGVPDFAVPAARPVCDAGNSRGMRVTKRAGI